MRYLYETVALGSFWTHDGFGSVYKVTNMWPSIGGVTQPEFTLLHIRTGEEYVRNYAEMRNAGLKQIDAEDMPLAVLGGS